MMSNEARRFANRILLRSVFCTMQVVDSSMGLVHIRAGDRFKLVLDENPTTGYRWSIVERDESKCTLVEEKQESVGPLAGGPSRHAWTFECKSPGTTEIALKLKRGWRGEDDGSSTMDDRSSTVDESSRMRGSSTNAAREFRLSIMVD